MVPVELLSIDTLNECAHLLACRKKTLGGTGDGSVLYDWCLENGVTKLAPEIVLDSPGRHPIGHKMHQYMVWESYAVFLHIMENLRLFYNDANEVELSRVQQAVNKWFTNPDREPYTHGNWNASEPWVVCDVMCCVLSPPQNGGLKSRHPQFWAQQLLLFAQNENDRRYQIRQRHRLLYAMGETHLPDMTNRPASLSGTPASTISNNTTMGWEVRDELRLVRARETFVNVRVTPT